MSCLSRGTPGGPLHSLRSEDIHGQDFCLSEGMTLIDFNLAVLGTSRGNIL